MDESGNVLTAGGASTSSVFDNWATGDTNNAIQAENTTTVLTHKLKTGAFGGGTYDWSIEGVESTNSATPATLSGSNVAIGTKVSTTNHVKVIAGWEGYVTVVIDTIGLTNNYTVTGDLSAKTLGQRVPGYTGYYANQAINIDVGADGYAGPTNSGSVTVADGSNVDVYLDFGSGHAIPTTAGYGLKITLNTGDEVLFLNDGSTWNKKIDVDNVREDMTIEIKNVVAIPAPQLDVNSIVFTGDANGNNVIENGETITFKFNEKVSVVSGQSLPTGCTLGADCQTITYTSDGSTTSIAFSAGILENEDGVRNTGVTITLDLSSADHFSVSYT